MSIPGNTDGVAIEQAILLRGHFLTGILGAALSGIIHITGYWPIDRKKQPGN